MSNGYYKTEIVNPVDAKREKLLHAARRDARGYVAALVTAVDARDPSATAHPEMVATYAETTGRRMGLGSQLTKTLANVTGIVRIAEANAIDAYRTETGKVYDATNGRWLSIDDPNGWW